MSFIKTNKLQKKIGDFLTRVPSSDDFTEYIYTFADGTKCVIARTDLDPSLDAQMYLLLHEECKHNRTELERWRQSGSALEQLACTESSAFTDRVLADMEREALLEALDQVSSSDRLLLEMKFYQEQTNVAIAEYLGVTEGEVRRRLKIVLSELRKKL